MDTKDKLLFLYRKLLYLFLRSSTPDIDEKEKKRLFDIFTKQIDDIYQLEQELDKEERRHDKLN